MFNRQYVYSIIRDAVHMGLSVPSIDVFGTQHFYYFGMQRQTEFTRSCANVNKSRKVSRVLSALAELV